MRKIILGLITAFSLAACSTAQTLGVIDDASPAEDGASAVVTDVLRGCELWNAVNNASPTASVRGAAQSICLGANVLRSGGLLAPDPDALNNCFVAVYFADQPEYIEYCAQRTSTLEPLILRASTLASNTVKEAFPDFPGASIVVANSETTRSISCGEIASAAACGYEIFIWPEHFERYPDAEAAAVYIAFHEFGHVLQHHLGLLKDYTENGRFRELQSDCIAGWIGAQNEATTEELERGLNLAIRIGGRSTGTHGSGLQRSTRLKTGYEGGVEECL